LPRSSPKSPYIYQTVPSLRNYFTSYPHGALPAGAAEVFFWSEDVMPHLRPILSVTHLVVFTPPELPAMTLAASKQIYANHYVEAAVDLTAVVDRDPGILRRGVPSLSVR